MTINNSYPTSLKTQEDISIKYVPIDSIRPAEYNPRKSSDKQHQDLRISIERFGIKDPIIVNSSEERKNIIIGGHFRTRVAKELGYKTVPVVFVDIPDIEKEKELNLRLNRNLGDFDLNLLHEFSEDMLKDVGFDSAELDKIFASDDNEKDDVVPETPEIPKAVRGDIYQLGRHRVMCGDSTLVDDVEKLLVGKEPYLMVTDPPYGVSYDADWRNRAERSNGKAIGGRAVGKVNNDDNADWSEAWSLSPSKVCYVWHAGKYASIVEESLIKNDFEIRSQIIWVKNNFAISRGDYHWKHEPCWYAVKKGNKGNWAGDRSQTTVWDINKPLKSETGHSTQKPVECMIRPISNHDGDVYDPFLGSGTTLIACEKTRRICYGMEIDPKYVDIIIKRWEDFTGSKATKVNG